MSIYLKSSKINSPTLLYILIYILQNIYSETTAFLKEFNYSKIKEKPWLKWTKES